MLSDAKLTDSREEQRMETMIRIGEKVIFNDSPCYVIAEIGHNHQGNIAVAKKMIDEAVLSGVDAVKLQKRSNRTLYTNEMFNKPYENENSFGKTYGAHREALEFEGSEYHELKAYSEQRGIMFFATAFDCESVDFLENIDVPAYKIASGDITNHPLIEYIAKKKKPIFMSTGACSLEEVKAAYEIARRHVDQICIMQCTAAYPAQPIDTNLNVILTYKKEFPNAVIGYSSHESGIVLPVVAYILGARVVEKHFTLNRAMKGTDHKFSHEPHGMKKMIRDLRRAKDAIGSFKKICLPVEESAIAKMGKSIVLTIPMAKGDVMNDDCVAFKSPGTGIPPSQLNRVLQRKLNKDLPEEALLTFDDLE